MAVAVFAVAFVFSFLFYLLLSFGSGSFGFWTFEEILFGILFAALVAIFVRNVFRAVRVEPSFGWLDPRRIVFFLAYLAGPLFVGMAKANLDVAMRVVSGEIKPGIVKVSPGLKTDLGVMMLANGITLTPGTLSVHVDKKRDLYVHWIYVKDKNPGVEDVSSNFRDWIRRVTE